jgi:hypothetical protein
MSTLLHCYIQHSVPCCNIPFFSIYTCMHSSFLPEVLRSSTPRRRMHSSIHEAHVPRINIGAWTSKLRPRKKNVSMYLWCDLLHIGIGVSGELESPIETRKPTYNKYNVHVRRLVFHRPSHGRPLPCLPRRCLLHVGRHVTPTHRCQSSLS